MLQDYDVIVIGGGIAGCSAAAELSPAKHVLLLEREGQPGYHSTGRSGAIFTETYGSPAVRALSRASRATFFNPDPAFHNGDLVNPRGALFVARQDQLAQLESFAAEPDIVGVTGWLGPEEVLACSPLMRAEQVAGGLYEEAARDVEVHSLQQAYLKKLAGHGGTFTPHADVTAIEWKGDRWFVQTSAGEYRAPVIVNASGAWADAIASLAGIDQIGLVPYRRTAILVDPPADIRFEASPLTIDISQQFYFKPDAGLVMVSPVDQTPSPPCDAQPDEMDIAIAVDNVQKATRLEITRIRHKWAGLRNFVPDHNPVVGYAPGAEGFFWLAAQGGYGIQTAPAMARLAAALVDGQPVPADIEQAGLSLADILPGRILNG